ncbi:hypothetical protein NESM_000324300 [Novymonas esmeraldas]|uniref:Uncharacterized protein n=1 Tax=Novymonas esmeraldas TaxID=1808958 RepID=A0AAW0EIX8_9TRYP
MANGGGGGGSGGGRVNPSLDIAVGSAPPAPSVCVFRDAAVNEPEARAGASEELRRHGLPLLRGGDLPILFRRHAVAGHHFSQRVIPHSVVSRQEVHDPATGMCGSTWNLRSAPMAASMLDRIECSCVAHGHGSYFCFVRSLNHLEGHKV